jgi:hypothetical protein
MTVVEGLTRAMRGEVSASRSELGGLRVDVRLRPARIPEDEATHGAAMPTATSISAMPGGTGAEP